MATLSYATLQPLPPYPFEPKHSTSITPTIPLPSSTSYKLPSRTPSPSTSYPHLTSTQKWTILTHRTPSHATTFIYAVLTTRIYCRPTCPSRLARRSNITFFPSYPTGPILAEKAGFRACKRCKPDLAPDSVEYEEREEGARKVERAIEIVKEKAQKGEKVELGALGREVGLSKWHLLRCFKRRVGVSPREMGEGLRRDMEGVGDGVKTPGLSERVVETPGSEELEVGEKMGMEWPEEELGVGSWGRDVMVQDGFNEEVERLIRDLFPEIYEENDMMKSGVEWTM